MKRAISRLSPKARKYILAAGSAIVGFGSDVSIQLQNADMNWTRAVVIGIVVGGFVRVLGAVLAVEAAEQADGEASE